MDHVKKHQIKSFICPHRVLKQSKPTIRSFGQNSMCKQMAGVSLLTFSGKSEQERIISVGCRKGKFGKADVYLGVDTKSGNVMAVLKLEANGSHLVSTGLKQCEKISKLKKQFKILLNLKHPNLCQYQGWQCDYSADKLTVSILTEYVTDISLTLYLKRSFNHVLTLETVRAFTFEILNVLQYLHYSSMAHRNLTGSNIFVDPKGELKISGHGLSDRLEKLFRKVSFSDQREDLYYLGILAQSFLTGKSFLKNKGKMYEQMPEAIKDFLHLCIDKKKFPHLTCKDLLTHDFFGEHIPKLLVHTRKNERNKYCSEFQYQNSNQESEHITMNEAYLVASSFDRQSRLDSEFEIIKVLGKGGFGDVYKVRNKIDGGIYAIKKIVLNPKSQLLNEKIMREVKLLSKLKHDHVVRYYCSWIEIKSKPVMANLSHSCASKMDSSDKNCIVSHNSVQTKASLLSNFDLFGEVETQDEVGEWLINFDNLEVETIGKYYDDNDVLEYFDNKKKEKFKTNSSRMQSDDCISTTNTEQKLDFLKKKQMKKILFIQMECCEGRTLRNTIDEGLYNNKERIWRLFREIIQGLVYIHEQDIIHRDLKPVNIFLDSFDHIKIGDFGLARTDVLCKTFKVSDLESNLSNDGSKENSLTGAIGSKYYVSPEVMSKSSRAYYDQKVDIYSLGIIFFEMCYRSFPTEHERGIVLNNLRLATVSFPKDFDIIENAVQAKLICWLLRHDPKLRPTSKDLMNSSLMPVPTKNETELNQIIHSVLQNPNSASYNQMLMAIFSSKTLGEQEINNYLANYENILTSDTALVYQHMKTVISSVFAHHGAIEIQLPLLLPNCSIYEKDLHSVKLMNAKGRIMMLPRDQRISFAHFIGRKNISFMKRFVTEKVFSENFLHDVHPVQVTECAFDIIFSYDSLFHDSETLSIVQEIMNKCCRYQAKKLLFKVNHMLLLKAVLLHCDISENMHIKILTALAETSVRTERATRLDTNLQLSKTMRSRLISFLDIEGPLHRVKLNLKALTSSTNKAGLLAKAGLEDIETVISFVRHLGFQSQIVVFLGLITKPNLYCGVFYQILYDQKKNGKSDVIATGGRYDELIESFRLPAHKDNTSGQTHGVGISILLEPLVGVLVQDKQIEWTVPYDILVCSLSKTDLTYEKINIVGKLWTAGFKADVLLDIVKDVNDLIHECLSRGISHILEVIKIKPTTIKVYSLSQESIVIKTMIIDELIEYIQTKQNETSPGQPEPPWHEICLMDTSWTDI